MSRHATSPLGVFPALLALATLVTLAGPARAQTIKPWVPPSADSLLVWASQAKTLFQTNQGDSAGGSNFRPYERIGTMGRRLLRSLGEGHLIQAHAIATVLDSLGLDTEVRVDPELPHFVLLMVRNPYRRTADAVGFVYWYREHDLRVQGSVFRGGTKPEMRVWWTGQEHSPYTLGVVDHSRDESKMYLSLYRLSPSGAFWNLVQVEELGPERSPGGAAAWVDINGDDHPELVTWIKDPGDSLFEECSDCPSLINEFVFVERPEGFRLHDIRLLPSAYASFVQFVRLLRGHHDAQASRLLKNPVQLKQAVADGWAMGRGAKTWKVELAEADSPWPRWLALRFRGPRGPRRYVVRFEQSGGRWVISGWEARAVSTPTPSPSGPRAR